MTFSEWLKSTQERRDALAAYGKSGGQGQDLNKAIELVHEAEGHLSDARNFLIQSRAKAMFRVKRRHPAFTSRERELLEKLAVNQYQAIVDACETTVSSLTKRYFTYGRR